MLAGDIFDGELRNFQTGLYFMDGMRRLDEAGIDVFMVLGNHDSANRFADKLSLTGNVHVFPKAKPATHLLDDVRVAIHVRSFPRPDVSEDIAREYHSSSASPNQATETRRCASSAQGGRATALTSALPAGSERALGESVGDKVGFRLGLRDPGRVPAGFASVPFDLARPPTYAVALGGVSRPLSAFPAATERREQADRRTARSRTSGENLFVVLLTTGAR